MLQVPNEDSTVYVSSDDGVLRCPTATRDSCVLIVRTSAQAATLRLSAVVTPTGAHVQALHAHVCASAFSRACHGHVAE